MLSSRHVAVAVAVVLSLSSCSPADSGPVGSSHGGTTGTGGTASGGATGTAGSASGGAAGAGGAMCGGATGAGGSARAGTTGTGGGAAGTGGAASAGATGTGGSAGGGAAGTGGAAIAGSGGASAGGRSGDGGGAAGASGQSGSGGTTGAGGAVAGASGALCPPSALVCEDFEDGKADGWSALVSGMTINGTHASSGTKALSLNIPANQRGGFISYKGAPLFPLVNKTMWGRVMVWFDSISDGHTDIVRGQAASGGNPSYNVAEQHGAYMMNYYNGSSATDCWKRPKAPTPTMVPLSKWQCWEWSFNAGTNDFQFFVDGALYVHVAMTGDGCLTGNGPWVAPTDFGMVSVGATIAETRPTVMQIWLDDIAIGTQERIGCPGR